MKQAPFTLVPFVGSKGQITVIIIMAVVLLLIFTTLNYINTRGTSASGTRAQTRQQLTTASMSPIKEYVTSCLDLATRESVTLIGEQGGNIYTSQGGSIIDYNDSDYGNLFLTYDEHRVAYAIYPPEGDVGGFLYAHPPHR